MTTRSSRLVSGSVRLRRPLALLILLTFVSAIVVLPFFKIGEEQNAGCCGGVMPVTHDMAMHLNQMQGFYDGLRGGSIYPRWQANTNAGMGAPTTIYYPPFVYYITSGLFVATGNWLLVLQVLYVLMMAGSGLAVYYLTRRFASTVGALAASIAYLLAPYHLLNHYQRGALAECLSFVWMPLTLALVTDLVRIRPGSPRSYFSRVAALSVIWGLFLWSHPPTAYQLLLIGGPALIVVCLTRRNLKSLVPIAASLLLGFALSAAYMLPAVAEQGLIHSADVEDAWPYHESYILQGSSVRYDHLNDDFVVRLDRIWLFTLIATLIISMTIFCVTRGRRREAGARSSIWLWLGISLYASLMMLAISRPVGQLVPKIEIGVFSWRMLAITSLSLSVLVGLFSDWVLAQEEITAAGRVLSALAVWIAIILVGAASFVLVVRPMYRAQAFEPNPDHSNYSLTPINAGRERVRISEVTIENGVGQYRVERWHPEDRRIDLTMTRDGAVGIRTFNFPGWEGTLDGKQIPLLTGRSNEISVIVPEGQHSLILKFAQTPVRLLGTIVSSVASILVALLIAIGQAHPAVQREAE